jgi:hypothetical protein
MTKLPQQLPWDDADNKWAAILNPVVGSPIVNGLLLKDVTLATGPNAVNHRLGRKLQGWIIIGINGVAEIYDNQASNQMPSLTLSLTSDADVIVSLWVF